MPYNSNKKLPESIQGVLPEHAQTIYRTAFNSAYKQYEFEETAIKVAWAAVKKSYEKRNGKWVKK